jgi:hypothetical protein
MKNKNQLAWVIIITQLVPPFSYADPSPSPSPSPNPSYSAVAPIELNRGEGKTPEEAKREIDDLQAYSMMVRGAFMSVRGGTNIVTGSGQMLGSKINLNKRLGLNLDKKINALKAEINKKYDLKLEVKNKAIDKKINTMKSEVESKYNQKISDREKSLKQSQKDLADKKITKSEYEAKKNQASAQNKLDTELKAKELKNLKNQEKFEREKAKIERSTGKEKTQIIEEREGKLAKNNDAEAKELKDLDKKTKREKVELESQLKKEKEQWVKDNQPKKGASSQELRKYSKEFDEKIVQKEKDKLSEFDKSAEKNKQDVQDKWKKSNERISNDFEIKNLDAQQKANDQIYKAKDSTGTKNYNDVDNYYSQKKEVASKRFEAQRAIAESDHKLNQKALEANRDQKIKSLDKQGGLSPAQKEAELKKVKDQYQVGSDKLKNEYELRTKNLGLSEQAELNKIKNSDFNDKGRAIQESKLGNKQEFDRLEQKYKGKAQAEEDSYNKKKIESEQKFKDNMKSAENARSEKSAKADKKYNAFKEKNKSITSSELESHFDKNTKLKGELNGVTDQAKIDKVNKEILKNRNQALDKFQKNKLDEIEVKFSKQTVNANSFLEHNRINKKKNKEVSKLKKEIKGYKNNPQLKNSPFEKYETAKATRDEEIRKANEEFEAKKAENESYKSNREQVLEAERKSALERIPAERAAEERAFLDKNHGESWSHEDIKRKSQLEMQKVEEKYEGKKDAAKAKFDAELEQEELRKKNTQLSDKVKDHKTKVAVELKDLEDAHESSSDKTKLNRRNNRASKEEERLEKERQSLKQRKNNNVEIKNDNARLKTNKGKNALLREITKENAKVSTRRDAISSRELEINRDMATHKAKSKDSNASADERRGAIEKQSQLIEEQKKLKIEDADLDTKQKQLEKRLANAQSNLTEVERKTAVITENNEIKEKGKELRKDEEKLNKTKEKLAKDSEELKKSYDKKVSELKEKLDKDEFSTKSVEEEAEANRKKIDADYKEKVDKYDTKESNLKAKIENTRMQQHQGLIESKEKIGLKAELDGEIQKDIDQFKSKEAAKENAKKEKVALEDKFKTEVLDKRAALDSEIKKNEAAFDKDVKKMSTKKKIAALNELKTKNQPLLDAKKQVDLDWETGRQARIEAEFKPQLDDIESGLRDAKANGDATKKADLKKQRAEIVAKREAEISKDISPDEDVKQRMNALDDKIAGKTSDPNVASRDIASGPDVQTGAVDTPSTGGDTITGDGKTGVPDSNNPNSQPDASNSTDTGKAQTGGADSTTKAQNGTPDSSGVHGPDTGTPDAPNGTPDSNSSKKSGGSKLEKAMMCATAAMFWAQFGMRIAQIEKMKKEVRGKACKNIRDLYTKDNYGLYINKNSKLVSDTQNNNNNNTNGNQTSVNQGQSNGSGYQGSSGQKVSKVIDAIDSCTASGSCNQSGVNAYTQSSSPAEAGVLNSAGDLAQVLKNLPVSPRDLVKKALLDGPSSAASAMLSPELGNVGAAMANIADAAKKDGDKLASILNMGPDGAHGGVPNASTYTGGGAQSASSSDSAQSGSLFPMLQVQGQSGIRGLATGGKNVIEFGKPMGLPDIWHKNTDMNLFQIVSDRISKSVNRVLPNPNTHQNHY